MSTRRIFSLAALLAACAGIGATTGLRGSSAAQAAPEPAVCSEAIHAKYVVKGPDGKPYPTWHPQVDPRTRCVFALASVLVHAASVSAVNRSSILGRPS